MPCLFKAYFRDRVCAEYQVSYLGFVLETVNNLFFNLSPLMLMIGATRGNAFIFCLISKLTHDIRKSIYRVGFISSAQQVPTNLCFSQLQLFKAI